VQALPGYVNGTAATNASTTDTAAAVLKTATYTSKQAFSSRVPIKALMELR
jgi:hypothetical protein